MKDGEKKEGWVRMQKERTQIRKTGGSERKEERRKGKSFSTFLRFLF